MLAPANRNALIFGCLAGVAMIAATVLVALGHPVPDFLSTIAIAAVAALAGVSLPAAAPTTGPVELAAAAAAVTPSQVYARPVATAPVRVGTVPAVAPNE